MLTTEGSPLTASMFRDIKAGAPVEADHVIGDLVARADAAKARSRSCARPTSISRLMKSSGVDDLFIEERLCVPPARLMRVFSAP